MSLVHAVNGAKGRRPLLWSNAATASNVPIGLVRVTRYSTSVVLQITSMRYSVAPHQCEAEASTVVLSYRNWLSTPGSYLVGENQR